MAISSYLTLTGQKLGLISGGVTQKGRAGTLEVIACNHEVISPRDAASGLPTGKRLHKPFEVTVAVDIATPLLYTALVNNENITKWELKFNKPEAQGTEQNYFTINLENANIASIQLRMLNNKNPELTRFETCVDVAFTYQKITWTINQPKTVVGMDDWEAPTLA
jgi:type VI secretion system secreted protein Hcp